LFTEKIVIKCKSNNDDSDEDGGNDAKLDYKSVPMMIYNPFCFSIMT